MDEVDFQPQQPQTEASKDIPPPVSQQKTIGTTPQQPLEPISPPKKKKWLLPSIIGIMVLILGTAGIFGYRYYQSSQQPIPEELPQPVLTTTPTPDLTANWKTFVLEKIQFKYPPDWKEPEYIPTSFGQSAEIMNNDSTQRIIILSGINKGNSKDELDGFINSLVEGGSERLTLDKSEAAVSKIEYQGSKIYTVYITSQDNTFHYSITLQASEAYSDQEMDVILDQILSTFKFTN